MWKPSTSHHRGNIYIRITFYRVPVCLHSRLTSSCHPSERYHDHCCLTCLGPIDLTTDDHKWVKHHIPMYHTPTYHTLTRRLGKRTSTFIFLPTCNLNQGWKYVFNISVIYMTWWALMITSVHRMERSNTCRWISQEITARCNSYVRKETAISWLDAQCY